jgi:hypothetical protein
MRITRSTALRAEGAALLGAIAGIIIQIATGVKYGPVPPGVVIIAATALLLTLVPWPGVRILGPLVPGFILLGGFVSSTGRTNISHPGHTGPFLGTLLELAALAVAVLAGLAALAEWRAGRRSARTSTGQQIRIPS